MLNIHIDQDDSRVSMVRIAQALRVTAPTWARLVTAPQQADVQVVQAIALNARRAVRAPRYAVIMHALDFESGLNGRQSPIVVPSNIEPWESLWSKALAVWSYYDMQDRFTWGGISDPDTVTVAPAARQLYLAPLGVNLDVFHPSHSPVAAAALRDVGVVTSGFISGPTEEAIEEVAVAAHLAGLTTVHLGPATVTGMTKHVPGWSSMTGISDNELAALYSRAQWVSGLRHGEGFELPVLEGLACGARPICFDTPTYRRWFNGHAVFVPECSGEELIGHLTTALSAQPMPVLPDEVSTLERFDWQLVAEGFWRALAAACLADSSLSPRMTSPPTSTKPNIQLVSPRRRRLIWVGDSPTTDWTGFGRSTSLVVRELLPQFDVTVLGTTHDGCPYDREAIPYDVYPISKGLPALVTEQRPDVVVVQHDPWHVQTWLREAGNVPVVGIMPIDGKNCRCDYLNGLALAIWWTHFAEHEARLGGYVGQSTVIPLGVDVETYHPRDTISARKAIGLPDSLAEAFIVGVVARNQQRKRLDLTVRHFAEWVKTRGVNDAYLYVQAAPTGEAAFDVSGMMQYEKLVNRLILFEPKLRKTLSEASMANVYSALDVYFSTTQGEGWGLPPMEAMACGVPVVAPDWSALGDWARDAAVLVPCNDIAATLNASQPLSGVRIAVLGGVPERIANVDALDRLYRDVAFRESVAARALALVHRPEYRWPAIGAAVRDAVEAVLSGRSLQQERPIEVVTT
jgi:D-inositol-3-phosphate glycosyltransferase